MLKEAKNTQAKELFASSQMEIAQSFEVQCKEWMFVRADIVVNRCVTT